MPDSYEIVPWFNSTEWHKVHSGLSAENSNKEDALNLLEMWKARCPALPSAIESTLCLLQVYVQDKKSNDDMSNEQMLRLAYSSAIMRFVNHMLDSETAKGLSLYNAAKIAGIPDWIVDLRHDAAHSHNIPSKTLLRTACTICLQWLQKYYWEHHKNNIHHYCNNVDENKIATLIYLCSCISICAHSKLKRISDIPDSKMQKSIKNDIKILIDKNNSDLLDYENITTSSLITLINSNAKRLLQQSASSYYVNKALIEKQSLILSLDLLEYLSDNEFNNKNKLNQTFVKCFELLLTFLHTHDLIMDFILALVKLTEIDDCPKRNKLAALWISEILAALKKSQQFVERAGMMNSSGVPNKKKEVKQLYRHWFPNEKLDCLILDLQKPVPKELSDINFIQPIISSYSPYVTYYVRDLISLVKPQLPKEVCDKICKLAKLISTPDNFPADLSSMKVYTVEDLNSEDNMLIGEINETNKPNSHVSITQETSTTIWRIASNLNWKTCPIGKLPMQNTDVVME